MTALRLVADENFNGHIIKALASAIPDLDIVRAQRTVIAGAPDPVLLEWAAQEGRILLTHDVATMQDFAYARVASGQRMPGILWFLITHLVIESSKTYTF